MWENSFLMVWNTRGPVEEADPVWDVLQDGQVVLHHDHTPEKDKNDNKSLFPHIKY